MCSPGKESTVNEQDETGFPICEYGKVHLCGLKRGRPKQAYFLQGRLLDLKWTWSIMCCCYSGWAAAAAAGGCVYMWLNVHYCSHFSLHSWHKCAIIHGIGHHYHPRSQAIFFLLFKNKKPQRRAAVSRRFWIEMSFYRQVLSRTLRWMADTWWKWCWRLGHQQIELCEETLALGWQ